MSVAPWRWAAASGVALLLLAGCADESEVTVDPTPDAAGSGAPAGAVTLLETRQQSVGEARVVAFNIGTDDAMVGVSRGDGPAETVPVQVGDAVSIDGRDWRVVRIEEGEGGDGAPGSKTGEVVIAPPG
ncbi:MAG: hypothetical protein LH477_01380 [Nocardioides sp.]|nr:hypothetical protein [Nocardioides sp.]